VLGPLLPAGCCPGTPLPKPVADAAISYASLNDHSQPRRRLPPIRVPNADGALCVASKKIEDLPPVAIVLRLHKDELHDYELLESLKARFDISARDWRLITLLRQHLNNQQMAVTLHLTPGTVKVYLHRLFETFSVHSRGELLSIIDRVRRAR